MTRALSSAINARIGNITGERYRPLVEVDYGTGTRFYSTEFIDNGSDDYFAELVTVGDLFEGVDRPSDLQLAVQDSAANRTAILINAVIRVYLWSPDDALAGKALVFDGNIRDPVSIGQGLITFNAVSAAERANRVLGRVLNPSDYPDMDPDYVGRMAPVYYGTHAGVELIPIAAGWITKLTAAITKTVTTVPLSDTSGLPSSGTVQIDAEQISFTGKTDVAITGCTRGANSTTAAAHEEGADTAELQSQYDYLVADAPAYAVSAVYVDGVRQVGSTTTLNGALTDTAATITIPSGITGGVPSVGGAIISDGTDFEFVHYTGTTATTLTGVTRGQGGTQALAWDSGDAIEIVDWQLPISAEGHQLVRFSAPLTLKKSVFIEVNDGIGVTDPGHSHSSSSNGYLTWSFTSHTNPSGGFQAYNFPANMYDGNAGSTYAFNNSFTLKTNPFYQLTLNTTVDTTGKTLTSAEVSVRCVFYDHASGSPQAGEIWIGGLFFGYSTDFQAAPSQTITKTLAITNWATLKALTVKTKGETSPFSNYAADFELYEVTVTKANYTTSGGTTTNTAGVQKTGTVTLAGNSTAETVIGRNVTADIVGRVGDATFGNEALPITRPEMVARHLLYTAGGVAIGDLPAGSFPATGNANDLALSITDPAYLLDVLAEIERQARMLIGVHSDAWRALKRPDSTPTPAHTFTEAEVLRDGDASSIVETRIGMAEFYNRIHWRAGLTAAGAWLHTGQADDATSQGNYGLREMQLDLPWIAGATDAAEIVAHYLARYSNPARRRATFTVWTTGLDAQVGDPARLNHAQHGIDITGEIEAIGPLMLGGDNPGTAQITLLEI